MTPSENLHISLLSAAATSTDDQTASLLRNAAKQIADLSEINRNLSGALRRSERRSERSQKIIEAARSFIRQELDNVQTHPCDADDDNVKAASLYGPVADLHQALASSLAPLNEQLIGESLAATDGISNEERYLHLRGMARYEQVSSLRAKLIFPVFDTVPDFGSVGAEYLRGIDHTIDESIARLRAAVTR